MHFNLHSAGTPLGVDSSSVLNSTSAAAIDLASVAEACDTSVAYETSESSKCSAASVFSTSTAPRPKTVASPCSLPFDLAGESSLLLEIARATSGMVSGDSLAAALG